MFGKELWDTGPVDIDRIELDKEYQARDSIWDEDHSENAMVNSIRKDGLSTMPVVEIIEVSPDNYRYVLLSGHRRIKALRKLGEKFVECVLKRNLTPSDRLALIIRYDATQYGFSDKEKDRIWSRHYFLVHHDQCGCDFSDAEKCKYQVGQWAREMGIQKSTAILHIRWSENKSTEDPNNKMAISPEEMGKPWGGSYHIHRRITEEERIRILTRAKKINMDFNEYVDSKIVLCQCPHCGKKLD